MRVTCYINLQYKKKIERNQVDASLIFITKEELFGLNERVIEEARWRVKKKLKTRFACIRKVPFARNVDVTMFRLMKTFIFICRGRHEGTSNVETYRDRQGQTGTDKARQGHTGTDKDKKGQAWTDRDKQGQAGTERKCPCLSLLVSVCPCLSLLVPACSWPVLGIDWHNW